MKSTSAFLSLCLCGYLSLVGTRVYAVEESGIIDRARATVGTEAALDGLVTLQLVGSLEPADPDIPSAKLLIIARKPLSQRLEIRVDDIVETTILNGDKGCIIRSNLNAEASQMRDLVGSELARIRYSTRQYFNFYQSDSSNGEQVALIGTERHRGQRCHKLLYQYPEGLQTVRYFSLQDDELVATVTGNGVESVNIGVQKVKGIQFPEKIAYYEDGRKLHTIVFQEIKVNQPLTAGIFDIPVGEKQ